MKIEAGKYYKMRDGRKIGPMRNYGDGTFYCVDSDIVGLDRFLWRDDGLRYFPSDRGETDIISPWDEPESPPSSVSAIAILSSARSHMEERAATYDSPEGERSMKDTVDIFNRFHRTEITEAQGWHFMQILKDVRFFRAKEYHADSAEDCAAYAGLKAEAKAKEIENV